MLREMAEALEALATERPLVLLLEDLHWSDPSTLDLVSAVARRREPARLLVIATYRPLDAIVRGHPLRAVASELALHGACEELALEPLGADHVGRYLAARCGDEVSARLRETIHRRTDGLPLFMVNVVDALIRQDLLVERAGRWTMNVDETEVETAVPESLRQMIEQQLAGLESRDLRLLEAASVAGTAFSTAALAAALGEAVEIVEDRCEALTRREQFIRAGGVEDWPDGTLAAGYRFRHVLYQQVLYERLPAARRASLHLQIGEREEAGFSAQAGERAAVLAVHFERARAAARSIRYRCLAAEHALQRCAFPEAIEHLTRARDSLDRVPDVDERLGLELDVLTTLGPALYSARGPGEPEVETVYLRARELAERLGEPARIYPALFGLWYVEYGRGHYAAARALGESLLALAQQEGDTGRLPRTAASTRNGWSRSRPPRELAPTSPRAPRSWPAWTCWPIRPAPGSTSCTGCSPRSRSRGPSGAAWPASAFSRRRRPGSARSTSGSRAWPPSPRSIAMPSSRPRSSASAASCSCGATGPRTPSHASGAR
jgi:hypothetical protein